ncbi:MAG: DNA translocase FtsK [Rhodoferax sp.]
MRQLKSELSIGTTKALALMDQLEQAAIVSACDQRGAREVLVQA